MTTRSTAWRLLHAVAPRTAVALTTLLRRARNTVDPEEVAGLSRQMAELDERLAYLDAEVRRLGDGIEALLGGRGAVDDQLRRLFADAEDRDRRAAGVAAGLQEQRRLSLRVAQLADLVFERLSGAPSDGSAPAVNTQRR